MTLLTRLSIPRLGSVWTSQWRLATNSCLSFTDRTNTCGDLRLSDVGRRVRIAGWVNFFRLDKFMVIRDAFGLTQVLLDPVKCDELPIESVVQVEGVVRARPECQVNPKMATGEIEVALEKVEMVQKATWTPFPIRDFSKASESAAMEHRYMSLRYSKVQDKLRLRSDVTNKMRWFLTDHGFVDVDTPTLFRRTPGGAQEFVVPTRTKGLFYSLTQSPQQFKQLLMVGGLDRYFQIAKCFRDEGGKKDRQPEFTQVDIELSFTKMDQVMALTEQLIISSWPQSLQDQCPRAPFPRMTHQEAVTKFGNDKPDLRFPNQIVDLTNELDSVEFLQKFWSQGYKAKAIAFQVQPGSANVTKILKECQTDLQNNLKAKNGDDGLVSHFVIDNHGQMKSSVLKKCSKQVNDSVRAKLESVKDAVGVLVITKEETALQLMSMARNELASHCLDLSDKDFAFTWVVDFPLFTRSEDDGRLESAHHPFTRPRDEDLELVHTNPTQVMGQHYDLVLNGQEVAGGSIRIHESDLQETILKDVLHLDTSELDHLLRALKCGCPPHGGIALGLERYLAILTGSDSIREVIAFPKSAEGKDTMSKAPAPLSPDDKERYHIEIKE